MKCTPARAAVLVACAAFLAGPAPQEDDEQKNTALLRIYPGTDQLVAKADALAAAGNYAGALEIYGEAQKQPNSLVAVEGKGSAPARYTGVLEFCLRRIASICVSSSLLARQTPTSLSSGLTSGTG